MKFNLIWAVFAAILYLAKAHPQMGMQGNELGMGQRQIGQMGAGMGLNIGLGLSGGAQGMGRMGGSGSSSGSSSSSSGMAGFRRARDDVANCHSRPTTAAPTTTAATTTTAASG